MPISVDQEAKVSPSCTRCARQAWRHGGVSIFSSKDEPEPKAGGRQREAPFGFGFWFWILRGRTSCRRGGNVGIATAISKGGGKGGKPAFRFSSLSTARHFHRAAWLYVGPLSSGAVFHARQEFLFGLLHRDARLGIGLFPCQLLQRGKTDAGLQILFAFRHLVEDLEGSGPARVGAAPFAVRFFDDLGYGARPVEVEVGIQIPPERWAKARKKPVLRQMGVDEIYLGKTQKFLTVVSNLETGEPLWFGPDRKQETLDEFFRTELSALQRGRITAACGHVGAIHGEHPQLGAPVPHRVRQVSRHAARQQGRGRGATGRVFPQRRPATRTGQRQALAAAQPVGASGQPQTATAQGIKHFV